jgi:aspartyl-tRNA(Asn)/glutamyl-tRNA(Gln) amidotransferase subunit A
MRELAKMPVEEIAPLIQSKQLSSIELTTAILDQAQRKNNDINAYIAIMHDQAKQQAVEADNEIAKGNYRGMYHGIPVGFKDNIYISNEYTTMGAKIHKHFKPSFNATVTEKLKKAGAITVGKLNMHEYAHGPTNNNPHFGACRNPWNLDRIPGSSSGGSAAATILGMASASLGSDTGGSIRIPASACGAVGLKPTHGRVSKYGVFPLAWSLDHVGPMTKTVKDTAGMLEIIAGFDQLDPTSINVPVRKYTQHLNKDIKDLVIGVNEDYFFNKVDSNVEKLVKQEINHLVDLGAKVELIKLPSLNYAKYALMTTMLSEPATLHHQNLIDRPKDFGEDVRTLLILGELTTAVDYLQAQQYRSIIKDDFREAFKKVDIMITPTIPFIPPYLGDDYAIRNGKKVDLNDEVVRFTGPGNLTGLPSLSIPCGLVEGMPVGLQIIGDAFQEDTILNVGQKIEQHVNFENLVGSQLFTASGN